MGKICLVCDLKYFISEVPLLKSLFLWIVFKKLIFVYHYLLQKIQA